MLPNLLIIGAMKCGTTSLHHYLNLHPEISMTEEKELDFFVKEINYHLGIDWYKSQFSHMNSVIRGESSPSYTKYPKFMGVPQRIRKHLPDVKLIYVVRNPIQRIISHYYHNLSKGREPRSLNNALSKFKDNSYILYSKYYMQIRIYIKHFGIDNILILDSEDLHTNRLESLQRIFRFLEVDESYYHDEFDIILHKTVDKRIDKKLYQQIKEVPILHKTKDIMPESINRVFFRKEIKTEELNDNIKTRILEYLEKDIDNLKKVSGLELKSWRAEHIN